MKKLKIKLLSIGYKQFTFYCFLLSFVVTVMTNILVNLLSKESLIDSSDLMNQPTYIIFLVAVLIAPIIETFIFQFTIIELGYKYIKKEKVILFTSAFLFGLAHFFNVNNIPNKILYFIITFFIGLTWAFIYMLAKKRKDVSPFLLILSIHAFVNLIGFFVNEFGRL